MDADSPDAYFSSTYSEARDKFLAAADAAGLDVHSEVHPLLGQDGETLALDVARCGSMSADKLLIVSSGCHGVEGYAGAGVQIALLRDENFLVEAQRHGVAVLLLHALNPWGMSWMRRATHENIDLNRNFQDFHQPLPQNHGYEALHPLLVPTTWPPSPDNELKLQALLARMGLPALQQVVSGGQYSEPEGLFYGGHAPSWSQQALRHVLRDHGRRCSKLAWVDLHSGLGPTGQAELIFSGDGRDAAQLERARAWWPNLKTMHDGQSSSATISGAMWSVIGEECPQAEFTGIGVEFGTVPPMHILQAMRADQWLENHPEKPLFTPQAHAVREGLKAVFFVDTPQWKQALLQAGSLSVQAAIQGLSASQP